MGMLIAYDDSGEIVATLDYLVVRNEDGEVLGLVDFEGHEAAGAEHTDIWTAENAKGSKHWPEYLGARIYDFRVELAGPAGHKRIAALVHKTSGARRDRQAIEQAIAQRVSSAAPGEPVDLRDIVGGPAHPLRLEKGSRGGNAHLPVLGRPL